MYAASTPTPAPLPHSGLGVASFILSLAAGLLMLILFGAAGIADSQPGGLDEESAAAIALGLLFAFTALALIVALGLGIAGTVQTGRSKLFGVLGTVFSSTALLGTLLLMLVGASLGA